MPHTGYQTAESQGAVWTGDWVVDDDCPSGCCHQGWWFPTRVTDCDDHSHPYKYKDSTPEVGQYWQKWSAFQNAVQQHQWNDNFASRVAGAKSYIINQGRVYSADVVYAQTAAVYGYVVTDEAFWQLGMSSPGGVATALGPTAPSVSWSQSYWDSWGSGPQLPGAYKGVTVSAVNRNNVDGDFLVKVQVLGAPVSEGEMLLVPVGEAARILCPVSVPGVGGAYPVTAEVYSRRANFGGTYTLVFGPGQVGTVRVRLPSLQVLFVSAVWS